MSSNLPFFRYHPDPLATRSIEASTTSCVCCGQARGYIYTASTYTRQDLPDDSLCPWCIADGSAAKRYELSFSDDYPLLHHGIDEAIIAEVCERTPGYASWQQERWLSCCDDACAFHGDASRDEIEKVGADGLAERFADFGWSRGNWQNLIDGYEPGGNPAIYRFDCLHCKRTHYDLDFT
ncbi:CbrC family protein [Pseudomonas sp. NPDC089530]|uniref:CbrC family protein n=1 Tax=Pseudomonas sp. NPDC089530 TaxID=3390651 RepID=UPI003D02F7D4